MLAGFARDQSRRGLRPRTISSRRRILVAFEQSLTSPLEQATEGDIERWLDSCRLSARSRYTYVSTLASFFDYLRRQRIRDDDPTRDILRPRLSRLVPRPASAEDVAYAISVAEPMMAAWLSLAAYQGLRCFEIAQLRREDVQEHLSPPLLVVADGKGGRQDVLTLNDQAELALRNYGMPRAGFLFLTRDRNPYKPSSVSRYIGRFLRSLGIDATAHRLRHLFITSVWQATHDLRITQETARHADPRTTSGYAAYDRQEASRVVRSLRFPRAGQLEHLHFDERVRQ